MKKLVLMASLLVLVIACNKYDNVTFNSSGIIVADGMIRSPEWLVKVVNGIADKYNRNPDTGKRIYSTIVVLIEHKNQKYLLVQDTLSSHSILGNRCFTISGEPIDSESSLYIALMGEENRTLVWSCFDM